MKVCINCGRSNDRPRRASEIILKIVIIVFAICLLAFYILYASRHYWGEINNTLSFIAGVLIYLGLIYLMPAVIAILIVIAITARIIENHKRAYCDCGQIYKVYPRGVFKTSAYFDSEIKYETNSSRMSYRSRYLILIVKICIKKLSKLIILMKSKKMQPSFDSTRVSTGFVAIMSLMVAVTPFIIPYTFLATIPLGIFWDWLYFQYAKTERALYQYVLVFFAVLLKIVFVIIVIHARLKMVEGS